MAGVANTESNSAFALRMEKIIFARRCLVIGLFALVTIIMLAILMRGLRIDASFTKQLPLQHEYMQTFTKHQVEFGGANRVLIAIMARDGDRKSVV